MDTESLTGETVLAVDCGFLKHSLTVMATSVQHRSAILNNYSSVEQFVSASVRASVLS